MIYIYIFFHSTRTRDEVKPSILSVTQLAPGLLTTGWAMDSEVGRAVRALSECAECLTISVPCLPVLG